MKQVLNITPVAKPRMTQRDRWMKRPPVVRYWAFADAVKRAGVVLPDADAHLLFVLPMPPGWSSKKKDQKDGMPHKAKPDVSNLLKALEDAARPRDDQKIWRYGSLTKIWGRNGRIEIECDESQHRQTLSQLS